ncbi:hypothetical protein G7K_4526-t1 [Saitoella complicata NRRL Y-17804]|uniref:NmrA-like domain-containing protein n=1 Tax=Saitoella complicata (strain BCRC 22490 / CBS 7301 / JCM 7358 / NBRC 10748 / NRRL Y-17804) TaxID=698492 RepID=A0A0E9NLX5_SAICN|nr:hypothetical protein G7K_4526-t1 [Saitoella complicata NRRL Y-17804]
MHVYSYFHLDLGCQIRPHPDARDSQSDGPRTGYITLSEPNLWGHKLTLSDADQTVNRTHTNVFQSRGYCRCYRQPGRFNYSGSFFFPGEIPAPRSHPCSRQTGCTGPCWPGSDISTPTSLSDFFKGADVVFAVTNFWEHLSKEQEIKDGKAIVDMAKECHVSLLIWSSLDDVSKVSKGKYTHVDHFDGKHAVEEYARSVEQPAVFFYAGCFASNFSAGGMGPKKQEDGSYVMAFPVPGSTIIPIFDVADTGMFVAGILNGPKKLMGQRVLGFSEFISLNDMVKQYSSVRGVQAKFVQIDYDTYEAYFPNKTVAKELYEMFAYMNDFGYYGETTDEEVKQSHEICVGKPTTCALHEMFARDVCWPYVKPILSNCKHISNLFLNTFPAMCNTTSFGCS